MAVNMAAMAGRASGFDNEMSQEERDRMLALVSPPFKSLLYIKLT